jgi:hypothetical protein
MANMIPESDSSRPRFHGRAFIQLLAALAAVLTLSASAHAGIIADGGFEAAGGGNVYFAGQSIDGGSWNVTKGAVFIDSLDPFVYDGSNSVNLTLANLFVPNSLDQTLSTSVGQVYLVNFWGNSDSANTFSLTENGLAVLGIPTSIANNGFPGAITNSSLFVDYSGKFVATSTTTDLRFMATGNPPIGSADGSVMIDDVSVQATPEPGSIVLTLTGAMGVGLLLGKKRLQKSVFAS